MTENVFLYPENAPSSGWLRLPFTAKNGVKGSMLLSSRNMKGETLQLPLPVHGYYRIILGMAGKLPAAGIRVRLAGDPAFVYVSASSGHWWPELYEVVYKSAMLDHSVLEIAPIREEGSSTFVYARLEKAEGEEMPSSPQKCGTLMVTNDGYWTYTPESLREALMPWYGHPDCDICFCVSCGDLSNASPTRIGRRLAPAGPEGYSSSRLHQEIIADLKKLGDETPFLLRDLASFSHSCGYRFHLSFRLGACDDPVGEARGCGFFMEHPEYRILRKDSVPYARWSIAFPEVRRHILDFLMEQYDLCGSADGINLILVRSMPLTGYEEPFLAAFREKYDSDPRDLAEDDPKVLEMRCLFVRTFLQEIRHELDRRNRNAVLSAIVPCSPERCRFFGIDVRKLAMEGLIGKFYVSCSSQTPEHRENFDEIDMESFGRELRGTNASFQVQMFFFDHPGIDLATWYDRVRNSGASGIYLWDGHTCQQSEILCGRLLADGTGDAACAYLERVKLPLRPVGFDTVDGVDYSHFPPHLAY